MVGATVVPLRREEALSGLSATAGRAAAAGDTEQHSPRHKQPLSASPLCSPGRPQGTAVQAVGRRGSQVTLPQGKRPILHQVQGARLHPEQRLGFFSA